MREADDPLRWEVTAIDGNAAEPYVLAAFLQQADAFAFGRAKTERWGCAGFVFAGAEAPSEQSDGGCKQTIAFHTSRDDGTPIATPWTACAYTRAGYSVYGIGETREEAIANAESERDESPAYLGAMRGG